MTSWHHDFAQASFLLISGKNKVKFKRKAWIYTSSTNNSRVNMFLHRGPAFLVMEQATTFHSDQNDHLNFRKSGQSPPDIKHFWDVLRYLLKRHSNHQFCKGHLHRLNLVKEAYQWSQHDHFPWRTSIAIHKTICMHSYLMLFVWYVLLRSISTSLFLLVAFLVTIIPWYLILHTFKLGKFPAVTEPKKTVQKLGDHLYIGHFALQTWKYCTQAWVTSINHPINHHQPLLTTH